MFKTLLMTGVLAGSVGLGGLQLAQPAIDTETDAVQHAAPVAPFTHWVLTENSDTIYLLEADKPMREGDHPRVNASMVFASNGPLARVDVVEEFDCANSRMRVVEAKGFDDDGNALRHETGMKRDWQPVDASMPGGWIVRYACEGYIAKDARTVDLSGLDTTQA